LRLDDQRRKCLAHPHNAKHIRIEQRLDLLNINVQSRHSIVLAGVVDQNVEVAVCEVLDLFEKGIDACRVVHGELKGLDAECGKVGDFRLGAGRGEDAVGLAVEF
jgi:hypothetical protein